jgi:SAM-dependent methyltransferase
MGIEEELDAVITRWGPWTAHNVELAPGIFTRPESAGAPNPRIRQVLQLVADLLAAKDDLAGARVADLGCLEGGFAIELALHGAVATGLEGRENNVERARFAASALGLGERCTFMQDDVRNFTKEKYGDFDVVLCLGLLYHLEAGSVFQVLDAMYQCTTRALVLDTHVSKRHSYAHEHAGRAYTGHLYREHSAADSASKVESRGLSSLDNLTSFWPNRASLYDALASVGFTSVLECHLPQSTSSLTDRIQLVAMKGAPADVRTVARTAEPLPPYQHVGQLTAREALREFVGAAAQLRDATQRKLVSVARRSKKR